MIEDAQTPQTVEETTIVMVNKTCPSCRNRNRAARRACKVCGGKGHLPGATPMKATITRDVVPEVES